jgi:hypothetical protein
MGGIDWIRLAQDRDESQMLLKLYWIGLNKILGIYGLSKQLLASQERHSSM